jgi:tetratricopeptide (TPR) repeat protein
MRIPRPALAALLPLAATAALAAEKPRDYKTDLRQAQSQQQRRQYKPCIQACEKMLEEYKESWQVKEITWLQIENLILDSQLEGALKTLAALAKAYAKDEELQTAVALRTGDVQRQLKQFDQAVATYRKAAEACAKTQPDQAAEALSRAAETLANELKQLDDAVAQYHEVEAKFGGQDPRRAAEALRRVAGLHESQTRDIAKAAAAYQMLTEKYVAVYDQGALAGLFAKAVDCLLRAEKPADAIATATKAEAAMESDSQKASFALRRAEVLLATKKFPEARAAAQHVLCAYPLEQGACQSAQAAVVESYRAESQWDAALGAARILYDAAADEASIRRAAQVVAQAFLAADANLVRANEFLAYQRFGPDGPDGKPRNEDDIATNHLAQVKYPSPSAEANAQFQKAIDAWPANYEGYRAKAYLYLYWGKPKEGAAHFRLAFKAADLAQVPAAAQELVLVGMKAYTASFRGLDRVFEYINHGPKGKSGKESIPDPFAGLP